jgi:hypothetical protein
MPNFKLNKACSALVFSLVASAGCSADPESDRIKAGSKAEIGSSGKEKIYFYGDSGKSDNRLSIGVRITVKSDDEAEESPELLKYRPVKVVIESGVLAGESGRVQRNYIRVSE